MKRTLLLLALPALLLLSFVSTTHFSAKALEGAWVLRQGNTEEVLLFMDGYMTHSVYDKEGKQFHYTRGGTVEVAGNSLRVRYEFDTKTRDAVGQTAIYGAKMNKQELQTDLNGAVQGWQRLDDGSSGLPGLWKITARKQGGNLVPIHQSGTRKTVKLLTGTRFQWAAIDPGTKQFMGTGGGSYTFADGKYTEHIEFFSRDSSRVGSSLSFDGKLENGDWHHSGQSSRGEPIYEVWSRK